MDSLRDYQECKDIETARCDLRDSCKGDKVFDKQFPGFDRATCVAYAAEHCRTREIGGAVDWEGTDVDKCVAAILTVDCAVLQKGDDETETLDPCAFINSKSEDEDPDDSSDDEEDPVDAGADS